MKNIDLPYICTALGNLSGIPIHVDQWIEDLTQSAGSHVVADTQFVGTLPDQRVIAVVMKLHPLDLFIQGLGMCQI